ncbi:MAG: tyrosine-type recombinase/integrase [Planctomycetaceae bacterium]|nr:tyrosine-type recombinase/integrase [Planctomycetaceae bacterium]
MADRENMMAQLWSEVQKAKGNRLQLGWFKPRNCWKKFKDGKTYYLHHPNSKAGYEAALLEWAQITARLDDERPNADIWKHHRRLFQIVKTYYERFGIASSERSIAKQVDEFLEAIEEVLIQPELPDQIGGGWVMQKFPQLYSEFIVNETGFSNFGTRQYDLPEKWQDRRDRLEEQSAAKHPQSIDYWIKAYLSRVERRGGKFIKKNSAYDRRQKLNHFRNWCDLGAHITTIDEAFLERYPCYLILMLNCAFRHVDISELRWSDLQLDDGRIVIQRNKLNQQKTAPVISYKLWDRTLELVKATMGRHPEYVFTNRAGGQVGNALRKWWGENRAKYGLDGKRLDFIRKTGSTRVAQFDRNLDEVYLGESLSTTARIHYSFNDGEPCQSLDDGLAHLGAELGFCDPPNKTIELTPELIEKLKEGDLLGKLQEAGIEI